MKISRSMSAALLAAAMPGMLSAKPVIGAVAQVRHANQAAMLGPRQGEFVNATELYPWSEGAIFRLYTSPGRVSDIALEAGETLVSVAAGDTVRWIVGNTASGSGAARREHILIRPTAAGLSTNLFILTDRHGYHLDVVSTAGSAMASVSWTYPKDSLISLQGSQPTASPPPPDTHTTADPTALRFGYKISGDDMPWRPLRAFDDGHHVYIEFPADIAASSAPPLFVTDGKAPELVNYRMRGRYYVVDRLFSHAELRMGDKPQRIVHIVHDDRTGA